MERMIKDGYEIYKIAKREGWIDKLLGFLEKKHLILMLGSSGVGKTNLLKSLTELQPEVINHATGRTTSHYKSAVKIGEVAFHFIDTPGQELHSSQRLDAIKEYCNSIDGLINVVAFGYHEYAEGMPDAFTPTGKVRKAYLDSNREREMHAVAEWSAVLGGNANYRLLTVVSKADLWWDRQEDVFEHYRQGPYFERLGEAKALNPIVLPHCSVFHKFYGRGPMAGTFDETDKAKARAELLRTLVEMVGAGGTRG
ncbi:GTPase domain-containing protein [Thermodesulfobacteriota bacterium]